VVFCPDCKAEWMPQTEDCPICGRDLADEKHDSEWILLGTIEDKVSADFARETLTTYEIPAVIVSKSGFFGAIGLTLHSFYSGQAGLFEVSVPSDDVEEAAEILTMTLGEKWHRKES